MVAALIAGPPGASPAPGSTHEAGSDTSRARFEVGVSTDLTNEQFYEDAFIDTIVHPRRLISSPESRVAGVAFASLVGTRFQRRASYRIDNELSLGNRLDQDALMLTWRDQLSPGLRLSLAPRGEYRHDRTFGRDLEELRGNVTARLRRGFAESTTFAELVAGGDLLRSRGAGASLLPDRNSGKASASIEHLPLFGSEWRAEYDFTARVFPDSSVRDHYEHGWEARWKRDFDGGASLLVETEGTRRITMRPASTSQDNFWLGEAWLEGEIRWGETRSWRARLGGEVLRYDVEDTTLYFDYQVLRLRLGPRFERSSFSFSVGPRAEALFNRLARPEEYHELGGFTEIEYLGGAWWTLTPAAGWREYAQAGPSDPIDVEAQHSSYAFYELGVLGDQPLGGGIRLRMYGTARYESHIDHAQDSRSLYFSLDVRRLF